MKTIKSIDGKSLLIGGLLASTIFFAMGATSPTDKWDDKQVWLVSEFKLSQLAAGKQLGWEATGNVRVINGANHYTFRKRVQ